MAEHNIVADSWLRGHSAASLAVQDHHQRVGVLCFLYIFCCIHIGGCWSNIDGARQESTETTTEAARKRRATDSSLVPTASSATHVRPNRLFQVGRRMPLLCVTIIRTP